MPDGATIKATLQASTPHDSVPVHYEGAVERLTDYVRTAGDAVLMAHMRQQAAALNATLTTSIEGQYEEWAE